MIIANEQELEAAFEELDEIWLTANEMNNRERFMELINAIHDYEEIHYPIAKPSIWARFEYWLYKKGILK